ncbi:MAG: hypothetical protein UX80_C0009G0015 [Candidatus Amesbacteria bacterium GW2011_GWA2_47_11b]|uniref:Uncharacterized protein n=2 Tax=Candidatus Amesiibacteriota TaxID=1752730 RepID=A0A0G1UJA9_9BACT|nr:MAG: hypothetical protein UX42_C0017G0002 [Microgenomates group bacterium GW2011_GWC1_46_20]KKU57800.1 MAG: hypothetical protein UX80_C0009G0015 [Candidatus Amesbacteria bacterium GW2011_GWA2_47_11b]KKU83894.1 MAG: hypothetical protein UY11_C0011G0002 [Candidatus Amesbacteria bacterium GW2011_GWC2_47_8]
MAVLDRTRKVSEYNQGGHLRFIKSSLNFCVFFFYEPTVSEARRVGTFGKLSVKAPRRFVPSEVEGSKARPKAELIK